MQPFLEQLNLWEYGLYLNSEIIEGALIDLRGLTPVWEKLTEFTPL